MTLTASQGVRASFFNRSERRVTVTVKFLDVNGATVLAPMDIVLKANEGNLWAHPIHEFLPGAVGEDGRATVTASITGTGSTAEEEKANLDAVVGLLEVFDVGDGSTRVAFPISNFQTGASGRTAP